ncbi:MAG: acylphosphatase [Opitutales bacterium]
MSECVFQLECWFEGRVQGVGFRVQTLAVARGFEVSGTVQNLVDGRVYLLAEGEEREVREFVGELQSELEHYIRKAETKAGEGPRRAGGFTITH